MQRNTHIFVSLLFIFFFLLKASIHEVMRQYQPVIGFRLSFSFSRMDNLTSTNERKKRTTTNLCVFFFSSLTSQHGQKNKRLETQILQMKVVIPVIKELRSYFVRACSLFQRKTRKKSTTRSISVYDTFIRSFFFFSLVRVARVLITIERKKNETSYVMTCIMCVYEIHLLTLKHWPKKKKRQDINIRFYKWMYNFMPFNENCSNKISFLTWLRSVKKKQFKSNDVHSAIFCETLFK